MKASTLSQSQPEYRLDYSALKPLVRLTPQFIVSVRHLISMTTRRDMIPSQHKLNSKSASFAPGEGKKTHTRGPKRGLLELNISTGWTHKVEQSEHKRICLSISTQNLGKINLLSTKSQCLSFILSFIQCFLTCLLWRFRFYMW